MMHSGLTGTEKSHSQVANWFFWFILVDLVFVRLRKVNALALESVNSQKAQKRLQRLAEIAALLCFARKNAGSSRTARGGLNRFLYRHSTHIQHHDFRPTFSSGTRFSTSGNALESQSQCQCGNFMELPISMSMSPVIFQDDVAYYSEPEREVPVSRTPKELPRCETVAALPDYPAASMASASMALGMQWRVEQSGFVWK